MKSHHLLTIIATAGLGALACSVAGLPLASDPTPLPTIPPVTATSPAPTAEPAATLIAPTPDEMLALPAPLYFISSADEQIWRLERDGVSLTQITRESEPVTGFDVSPVNGSLLYVSNNDLIRSDARGNDRATLVDGQDFPPDNFDARINIEISNPRWSPDGSLIAFGMGGVNLMPSGGGDPSLMIASDPVPTLTTDPQPHPLARFYRPYSWSPDGATLLVQFQYWPEGASFGFFHLGAGSFVELTASESPCCFPTWAPDSHSIYFGNDMFGLMQPGLWRVNAESGATTTLMHSDTDSQAFRLARDPLLAPDGKLYFFFASPESFPEGNSALSMHRAEPDGVSALEPLRADSHTLVEALWAASGRGAVIISRSRNRKSTRLNDR